MNSYVNKTVRLEYKKAERLNMIRRERDVSWNAIINSAIEAFLENGTGPKQPEKQPDSVPELEPHTVIGPKKEVKPEPELTLDMSKLKLNLGDSDDGQI